MLINIISKDLLLSARANNDLRIQRILKDKTNIINPNLQDETGKTALHYAVKNINLFTIRSILENKNNNIIKANINIQDNNGYTVLHYLIKTINSLKFASINSSFYHSDNYIILKTLFEYGIDINLQDYIGNTALHYAMHKKNFFLIEELLTNKANPFILNKARLSILDNLNTTNYNLKNAIMESLYSKYPHYIKFLEISGKIIIYSTYLPCLNSDNQMLLGNNETFENIDSNA